MRRGGLLAMLVASLALAIADRAIANPALYPIDLQVLGSEDAWHSENLFELFWTLPPVTAADLPVSAIGYRVHDEAGTVVVRPTRLEGARTQVTIQIPPRPGVYRADLWLEGPEGKPGFPRSTILRYDPTPPGTASPLAPEGWIAGSVPVAIAIQAPAGPAPLSGIRGYAVSLDRGGETWPCAARDRCEDAEIDLLAGGNHDTFSLGTLPEGLNTVQAVAVSGAGIASAEAGTAIVRVDATQPEVVLSGGLAGWAAGPVRVVASATDALSGMAPGGPDGPFTAIAIDGGVPRTEPGDSAAVTVTGEGIHRVNAYGRDAAGNVDDRRPRTVEVAIDLTPPTVAFVARQDPAEPERIEAAVADTLSGAAPDRGSIAVRKAGSSRPWAPLPTVRAAGRLVADWDSDSYPEGVYEFRATAYDGAGNAAASNRRSNHTRMVLVNPLKQGVRLRAGFASDPGATARTVPFGRRVSFGGRLTTATGPALGGLPIRIVESFAAGADPAQRSTKVATAADGTFALRLAPGPSRQVEATFAGTRTLSRTGSGPAELAVRAGVGLRTSTKAAQIGGAPIVFSGRVRRLGARLPSGGLPVELQFKVPRGTWSEFRTVQTDARGRFRYPYAFSDDDSHGVRFRFRAHISGGDWPYEPSASKAVVVAGR